MEMETRQWTSCQKQFVSLSDTQIRQLRLRAAISNVNMDDDGDEHGFKDPVLSICSRALSFFQSECCFPDEISEIGAVVNKLGKYRFCSDEEIMHFLSDREVDIAIQALSLFKSQSVVEEIPEIEKAINSVDRVGGIVTERTVQRKNQSVESQSVVEETPEIEKAINSADQLALEN